MDFGITQDEIKEEIQRIKEEEKFKNIVSEFLNKNKESFEDSFKTLKQETEILLKSKDEEIEKLKKEVFEVLKISKEINSCKDTIRILKDENLELRSKILNNERRIIAISSQFHSVNGTIDSIRKDYLEISNGISHKEEDLDMLKINIKRYLKSLYYSKTFNLNTTHYFGCNNSNPFFRIIKIDYEYVDNYTEIKSSLSKYIIKKVYKYLGGFSLNYKSGTASYSSLLNSKQIFICEIFNEIISKDEILGKIVSPILNKYNKVIPKCTDIYHPVPICLNPDLVQKEYSDLAPQIAKELLMALP